MHHEKSSNWSSLKILYITADSAILHHVCIMKKAPIEVVASKLLDIGGHKIALVRDNDNGTTLNYACVTQVAIEVISKFIDDIAKW